MPRIAEYKQIGTDTIESQVPLYDEEGNPTGEYKTVTTEKPKMGLVYRDMTEEEVAAMEEEQKRMEEERANMPPTTEERVDTLESTVSDQSSTLDDIVLYMADIIGGE